MENKGSIFKAEFPGCILDMDEDGRLTVVLNKTITLKHGLFEVTVDGIVENLAWMLKKQTGQSVVLEATGQCGKYRIQLFPKEKNAFGITFKASLKKPAKDFRAVLMSIPSLAATHVLTQGMKMGGCESILLPLRRKNEFCSWYQAIITNHQNFLRISTPLNLKHFCVVKGRPNGKNIRALRVEISAHHSQKKVIEPSPVYFTAGNCGFELLENYLEPNAPEHVDNSLTQAGWNSWDYYRWTITEDAVISNAEFIAKDPVLSQYIKRIIVDDGWQYCYGEWEANCLFSSGMAVLAEELKKLKFIPGLWFAPGIAEPHSRIAQMDSDMLAISEGGQPCLAFECMRRYGFLLDPTVEKTRRFLYELFQKYSNMGYGYFKLDFLSHIFDAPRMHDQSVQRTRLVAELLRPIRQATQGKAKLLGCNYPFFTDPDLVDAVRIGSDIHATWGGICHNTISVAARYWMNRHFWISDPDFALCRSFDTSGDKDLTRLKCRHVFVQPDSPYDKLHDYSLVDINQPQAELLLSLVLMNAGAVNISDNLCRLNKAGLELARKVVSAQAGDTARPLDLFTSARPCCFLQKFSNGHRLLLINWNDKPEYSEMDLRKHGIQFLNNPYNFWTGQKLKFHSACVTCELRPKSCLLIVFN